MHKHLFHDSDRFRDFFDFFDFLRSRDLERLLCSGLRRLLATLSIDRERVLSRFGWERERRFRPRDTDRRLDSRDLDLLVRERDRRPRDLDRASRVRDAWSRDRDLRSRLRDLRGADRDRRRDRWLSTEWDLFLANSGDLDNLRLVLLERDEWDLDVDLDFFRSFFLRSFLGSL